MRQFIKRFVELLGDFQQGDRPCEWRGPRKSISNGLSASKVRTEISLTAIFALALLVAVFISPTISVAQQNAFLATDSITPSPDCLEHYLRNIPANIVMNNNDLELVTINNCPFPVYVGYIKKVTTLNKSMLYTLELDPREKRVSGEASHIDWLGACRPSSGPGKNRFACINKFKDMTPAGVIGARG